MLCSGLCLVLHIKIKETGLHMPDRPYNAFASRSKRRSLEIECMYTSVTSISMTIRM